MGSQGDGIDDSKKHTEGDHVPCPALEGEGCDQGLADEVERGTKGYQTRHQADVAEGGDG